MLYLFVAWTGGKIVYSATFTDFSSATSQFNMYTYERKALYIISFISLALTLIAEEK